MKQSLMLIDNSDCWILFYYLVLIDSKSTRESIQVRDVNGIARFMYICKYPILYYICYIRTRQIRKIPILFVKLKDTSIHCISNPQSV